MVIPNSEFRIPNSCAEVCYNTPMKTPTSRTCRLSIVVTLLISLTACAQAPAPVDPAYAAEVEEWRSGRLERLTAADGWLTLTGLFWLEEGESTFGSAEDNPVVIPDGSVPGVAGQLVIGSDGVVKAKAVRARKSTSTARGSPRQS